MALRPVLIALMLLLAPSLAAHAADEVRVLIDVSGSMKRTDPNNLRAPALRLLVGLLPADSRAGVWTFGQYVNNTVPEGAVDRAWRAQAQRAAGAIHSRGLFTDIGAALDRATRDWQEPDPDTRRSIILLSDGMVDVSKEPGANDRARRRLLKQTLPALQRAGINVHTIALSTEADAALLERLATGTGASFEQTDSAERLQRLFLRLFERAVARDSLPLDDNRFTVDDSISELTLLAFRDPAGEPVRLLPPGGVEYSHQQHPPHVRWHRENGYELVTVDKPAAGEWRLLAQLDPDNRVMIVTDLQLQTSELPNNLLAGEKLPLKASLTEDGKIIDRQEFLEVIALRVEQHGEDGTPPRQWRLSDNGLGHDRRAGDGVFELQLDESLSQGAHRLSVLVDGRTFQRQKNHTVRVYASPLSVERDALPGGEGWRLDLRRAVDWVDAESLRIGANLRLPEGGAEQLDARRQGPEHWQLEVRGLMPGLSYPLTLEVAGRTEDGREFRVQLDTIELRGPAAQDTPAEPPAEPTPDEPHTEENTPEAPDDEGGINWLFVGAVVVVGNLALFGIIGIIVHMLRQRRMAMPSVGEDEEAPEAPSDDGSKD
ncbi:VWA domain-containing protein [Alkalilimnicola sp. S0819]|uniref:VWA domain-containing protein n=1 Tax=Alkalilimnicola sp. S0819 TaxID=2613922 RepID=UPI001869C3A7|nr:vWA domain-containing protein [Alkalilimnicola sp. S0819]